MAIWRLAHGATLEFPPPLAAGIVNVTDDSFFAGARSGTPEQAIADGLRLAEEGFDMLDVGAVAARAGEPIDPEVEAAKLVPAVEGLAARVGVPILADTFSPAVARQAVLAGAHAINDISGGSREMFELVAELGCGYVLMHIEGPPRVDRDPPRYDDVVAHVRDWFAERLKLAAEAGVDPEAIVLDPGPDFDLGVDDNLALLRNLEELRVSDRPIFAAISRKDFLGAILAGSWEGRLPAEERGHATSAATALAVSAGADILRLHDREALDAMRVAAAIEHGEPEPLA